MHKEKTQYFVLICNEKLRYDMYGAGEGNRTLIISLEG